MALGTLIGGWRIVHTMGSRITRLAPHGGFVRDGGAITLFMASSMGIPVSTTHTITGAIVGVGAIRRMSAVRWGLARRIVWAWVLTIPAAAMTAAVISKSSPSGRRSSAPRPKPGLMTINRPLNACDNGAHRPCTSSSRRKIDRDIADLIALYVRKAGWEPHVVASGSDALIYAQSNPVDALVLDVMMPGMSGLEVCRTLRADKTTAVIPIIIVTARAEETDRILGLDLGADDYIAKPFSPNELIARLGR